MKFIISIILMALVSYVCGVYELPWWSIAVVACVISVLIHQKPWKAFLSGFIAILLLWGGLAWFADSANEHILSQKLASVLPFNGRSFLLIVVTAVLGAIVSGMGALTGSLLRTMRS